MVAWIDSRDGRTAAHDGRPSGQKHTPAVYARSATLPCRQNRTAWPSARNSAHTASISSKCPGNAHSPTIHADLYGYGYRFYQPEAGRWVNRDPKSEAAGINLLVFIGNSPLHRIDPLGLAPIVLAKTDDVETWSGAAHTSQFPDRDVKCNDKVIGKVRMIHAYVDASFVESLQSTHPDVAAYIFSERGNTQDRGTINAPGFLGSGFAVEFIPAENGLQDCCCKKFYWYQEIKGWWLYGEDYSTDDTVAVDFPGQIYYGIWKSDKTSEFRLRLYCQKPWYRRDVVLHEILWSSRVNQTGVKMSATTTLSITW